MYKIKQEILKLTEFAIRWKHPLDNRDESEKKYNSMLENLKKTKIEIYNSARLETMQANFVDYHYFLIRRFEERFLFCALCSESHVVQKFEREEDVFEKERTRNSESLIIIRNEKKVETYKPSIKEDVLKRLYGY